MTTLREKFFDETGTAHENNPDDFHTYLLNTKRKVDMLLAELKYELGLLREQDKTLTAQHKQLTIQRKQQLIAKREEELRKREQAAIANAKAWEEFNKQQNTTPNTD